MQMSKVVIQVLCFILIVVDSLSVQRYRYGQHTMSLGRARCRYPSSELGDLGGFLGRVH